MNRFLMFLLILTAAFLAACGGDDVEEPADPVALLTEAGDNIRSASTFRMEIRQEGVDFVFTSNLGEGAIDVAFRRALGQYVAPDQLEAEVSIVANGITTSVLVYGRGEDQWYRLPIFGWQHAYFAEGFNPARLIAEDSGFQAAMASLLELVYEGTSSIDGKQTYHLSGKADGGDVSDLLVGLIEDEGTVDVDVYVDVETRYPLRIVITQPETDPDDPMTWIVDLYDIGAPADLTLPPDLAESA